MRKTLLAIGVALLVGGITPPPASAEAPPPGAEAYDLASTRSGDAVPFDKTLDQAGTTGVCEYGSAWDAWFIAGYNVFGDQLWRFVMEAHKCWKPLTGLTYFKVFTHATTSGPWQYDGIVGSINDGFPLTSTYAYRWRQAKFHWCLTWYCPDVLAWLSVRAVAGGSTSTWSWKRGQE